MRALAPNGWGPHLHAAHGLTAESYRERYGLLLRRALEAPDRRAARGASTRERVARSHGWLRCSSGERRPLAGELAAGDRGKLGERSRRSAQRPERQQLPARSSRRGVQANQAAADERLAVRGRALRFAGLMDYLRARHAAGCRRWRQHAHDLAGRTSRDPGRRRPGPRPGRRLPGGR